MRLTCFENNKHSRGSLLKMPLLMLLLMSGCVSTKMENSHRLMMHPQFELAVINAPEFTREVLKTINKLEYEIERRK